MNKKFKMTKCFQSITPESAENGDFSETDFVYENREFGSLEEMADEIRSEGYIEASSYPVENIVGVWYTTTEPEINYFTAEEKYYTFHPECLTIEETIQLHNLL